MKLPLRLGSAAWVCLAVSLLAAPAAAAQGTQSGGLRFEVSFPAFAHEGAITGRVFVVISKRDKPEPRFQAGSWGDTSPIFAADVSSLAPGRPAVLDATTPGYPLRSLRDIPPGDYYVQALANIYTEFHRSDGHTIWAHMDQWEGQHFTRSPGNLVSEVRRVHLDPASGYNVQLELTRVLPALTPPADTKWVKHIKIQSDVLTKFWGHPMFIGAIVLLPKDYDAHPAVHYPVLYAQGH